MHKGGVGRALSRMPIRRVQGVMRFIHTADWQLGMCAAQAGPRAAEVREARLTAARRVVEWAGAHAAEMILVAGDTFENHAVPRGLAQQAADILGAFFGPVFLLPGNHDPWQPGSLWHHPAWRSYPNIRILEKREPILLPGAVLYPCPVFAAHSREDPTAWIPRHEDRATIAVGLAHGSLRGVSADDDHPIDPAVVERAGLDYLALGHWHSISPDLSTGPARAVYSGTHETTKFGERDSGNVLLVEIDGPGAMPKIVPLRTGILRWERIASELRSGDELDDLIERIDRWEQPERTLLEVELSGTISVEKRPLIERLCELADARMLFFRCCDERLRPRPDDSRWIDELPSAAWCEAARRLHLWACGAGDGVPILAEEWKGFEPNISKVAAGALMELYSLWHESRR